MKQSVVKGRRAERDVARQLTEWARPYYVFRRRGLGHASVTDLVVTTEHGGVPAWPYTISVKGREGPSLPAMLRACVDGVAWAWWAELEPDLQRTGDAWLIWKRERTWLLSCARSIRAFQTPPAPTSCLVAEGVALRWPRYTCVLDTFLARTPITEFIKGMPNG